MEMAHEIGFLLDDAPGKGRGTMIVLALIGGLCVAGIVCTLLALRDRPWAVPTHPDYDSRHPGIPE